MKLGVVNKSTAVNRFVVPALHRNLTHLAVITQKKSKLEILKGGGKVEKSPFLFYVTVGFPILLNVNPNFSLFDSANWLFRIFSEDFAAFNFWIFFNWFNLLFSIRLKYGQWVCLWDDFFVKVTLTFSSMASLVMNP